MKNRFRGNQVMITKIFDCVEKADEAAARAERKKVRDTIGVNGFERRAAAQAKRERKRAASLQRTVVEPRS